MCCVDSFGMQIEISKTLACCRYRKWSLMFRVGWGGFGKKTKPKTDTKKTDVPLRAPSGRRNQRLRYANDISAALFKDGARKHKRRIEGRIFSGTRPTLGVLPWFDPTSEYPIHSSELSDERSDGALLALIGEFKKILRHILNQFLDTDKTASA